MDVFSLGCVIAEILLEGTPLFDFARLQDYRKGVHDPRDMLELKIGNQKIVALILDMIKLKNRSSIKEYLQQWVD